MVGRGNVFDQPGPGVRRGKCIRGKKWGIFIWVKKGDVYLEKEERRVSGIRKGEVYLGLRSGSESWIRRGKCSLGKKGLSDSAVARLDLFVGSIMSTEGASF